MLELSKRRNVNQLTTITFGQSLHNDEGEVYTMSAYDFEKLGVTILTHLQGRIENFRYLKQMLLLRCTALMDFTAFLMLEELTVLIQEMQNEEALKHLTSIYKAFKLQAYSMFRIVAESK